MSTDTVTGTLVRSESTTIERFGMALTALAALTVALAILGLFVVIPVSTTVAGIAVSTLLGTGLLAVGLGVVAAGIGSWVGPLETDPSRHGSPTDGVLVGCVWLATVGLVAAHTLGTALWPLLAIVGGGLAAAGATFFREDVGVPVVGGGFVAFAGAVLATGTVGPGWQFAPSGFSVTLTGTVGAPLIAFGGGLLGAWTAARVAGGFGARGRQNGAYALIGTNAVGMLSLLLALVGFIVSKGIGPATQGIRYGIYWQPQLWFEVPILDEYVIIHGPELWFHWPFVMNGYTQLSEAINGVLPAIVGTVWLVIGTVVFAVPLGIGAAVFLTEYAEQGRFTSLIEIATNGLWSTPSIVFGLFGLAFLVPRLGNTPSLLAGQLVLAFMLLPVVVITTREALLAVPDEYRDASAALGVTKWETIKSVVLPAAMPGIITGVILGVGRIAGETAPILLVLGSQPFPRTAPDIFSLTGGFPFVELNLVQPASALPYQLYAVISGGVGDDTAFAWGTAFVLLLVVLSFYAIGIASRAYFRRKLNQ
ncbi:MAG: phosphate ABC transporter permease PstA [Halorhabdus sp.]